MKYGGEFAGDKASPVFFGPPLFGLGLKVSLHEGAEQVVGDEEKQGTREQGVRIVLVGVVAMPLVAQFIEREVLDVPTAMAGAYDGRGIGEQHRQARYPKPLGSEGFILAAELPMDGGFFKGLHDAHRFSALRPRGEPLQIPAGTADVFVVDRNRCGVGKQAAGIFEQIAVFVFEDGDKMLVVAAHEFPQFGVHVEVVAADHLESPRVALQHPGQQPQGTRHLAFAGPLLLRIEQQPLFPIGQIGAHISVVVLGAVALGKMDQAFQTILPAATETGYALVAVQDKIAQTPAIPPKALVAFAPAVPYLQDRRRRPTPRRVYERLRLSVCGAWRCFSCLRPFKRSRADSETASNKSRTWR